MANRSRTNPVQFYLDDDEQYILDEQFQAVRHEKQICFLTQTHFVRICL